MSRRPHSRNELPRDTNVLTALRRELNRNSRHITQTFWREFEQIRNQQRHQLEEERSHRERIGALMRDANQEAVQQAETLSRSISSHGINPLETSPRMQREQQAIMPKANETKQQKKTNAPTSIMRISESNVRKQQQLPASSTSSTRVPRAPPSNSPNTSNVKLTQQRRK